VKETSVVRTDKASKLVRPGRSRGRNAQPVARNARKRRTISQYLIDRLYQLGIRHVFGIPGDYVLGFYDQLCKSRIEVVGTTREDCAGFAADAYARIHGLGAVCVTYCVGGLSVVNSVAGAYAEKSPLVVISGAPGLRERGRNALLHHKVRDFDTQRQVFEKITVANAALEDPLTAFREIDRVVEASVRYKRPVYLELPRDRADVVPLHESPMTPITWRSDAKELSEAIDETSSMLADSKRPVMLIGVEAHRFGLQDLVVQIAEKNHIPMCSTLLGKSVVSESHPLYVGVYEGAMGREAPRKIIEDADCVLMIGTFMTDINLGIYTAQLDPAHCICATSEDLRIRHHHYHDVLLTDFVKELAKRTFGCAKQALPEIEDRRLKAFEPRSDTPVTVKRLFQKVNAILTEEMVVICDVGDALFAGADLTMLRRTEFLAPAYYTSMGFAVPAALGVLCADPRCRPIVLVGDGAFQMTGMELSTIFRRGLAPIVIVLNNKGYSTERFILDGPFNDIGNWAYHKIPELIGGGWGFEVRTETDLVKAVDAALANRDSFSLLNVHLDPYDRSEAMDRLTRRLAQQLGNSSAAGRRRS
jgi:indolepyruvate decarboxylase